VSKIEQRRRNVIARRGPLRAAFDPQDGIGGQSGDFKLLAQPFLWLGVSARSITMIIGQARVRWARVDLRWDDGWD
jgi:hypothetical protein